MRKLLYKGGGIPIVHEFNPSYYIEKNNLGRYLEIMKESYSYFIDTRVMDDKIEKIPVERLEQFCNETRKQTDIFFIK